MISPWHQKVATALDHLESFQTPHSPQTLLCFGSTAYIGL